MVLAVYCGFTYFGWLLLVVPMNYWLLVMYLLLLEFEFDLYFKVFACGLAFKVVFSTFVVYVFC